MRKFWTIGLITLAALVGGFVWADWWFAFPDDVERRFVGRDSCVACHQEQAALFAGSHHDLAMDVASESTVLGDFNDRTLDHHGTTSRLFRDGARFMIRTEGEDGKLADFEVAFVFGAHPLQQYMVRMPQNEPPELRLVSNQNGPEGDPKVQAIGRLQVLRVAWDVEEKKWFHLDPSDVCDRLTPTDPLHWTGGTMRWNTSCARCHSTNLHKNFRLATNSFHTTFSEVDVSCEACHGPGSLHVNLANSRSFFWDRKHGKGLTPLSGPDNVVQVESCAPCHSRSTMVQAGFEPGKAFDQHFACQLLTEPVYHADGQIRDEVFVYGSFVQSRMYHENVSCTDCHDPHSAKLKFEGNQLCTSCHQHPAGKYDTPAHHFHQAGEPGSFCVDCHMPATTYMEVDPRRDHSFRVPRPDLSVEFGTPNACTGCHLESERLSDAFNKASRPSVEATESGRLYQDWLTAAEAGNEGVASELKRVDAQMKAAIEKWYGAESPSRENSYYQRLARARSGDVSAAVGLANDREVPEIIRATALQGLALDESTGSLNAAMNAASAKSALVSFASVGRLENELIRLIRLRNTGHKELSAERDVVLALAGQLEHDSPQVCESAAVTLNLLPQKMRQQLLTPEAVRGMDSAIALMDQNSELNGDRAAVHLVLGGIREQNGELSRAKQSWRNAMLVEPFRSGPRTQLANMLSREARQMQADLLGDHQYSPEEVQAIAARMAGVMQQARKLRNEEHEILKIELERFEGLPGVAGLHYQFAMSCLQKAEYELAKSHYVQAHEFEPENETYLMGLVNFCEFRREYDHAVRYARALLEISDSPEITQTLKRLEAALEKSAQSTD